VKVDDTKKSFKFKIQYFHVSSFLPDSIVEITKASKGNINLLSSIKLVSFIKIANSNPRRSRIKLSMQY